MEPIFETLLKVVREYLSEDSSGHDYFHAERVFRMALKIQEQEGGDAYVIGVAAIMHDILRPWEKKTGRSHFGSEALQIITELLEKNFCEPEKLSQIIDVIAKHDIYDWSQPTEKLRELQIVQDADNLDAIGAIGIARTFAFGGAHNCPLWKPEEILDFDHDFIENGKLTTTIGHFYEKLLKLAENMNTETGKKLALERHHFMEKFLEQFFDEWKTIK